MDKLTIPRIRAGLLAALICASCRERPVIRSETAKSEVGSSPAGLPVVLGDAVVEWEKPVQCEGSRHPAPGTVLARISKSEIGVGAMGPSVYFYGGSIEVVVENRGNTDVCLLHLNGLSIRVRSLETGECSVVYDLGGGDRFLKEQWHGVAVRVRKGTATTFRFGVEKMWRLLDSPPPPAVARNFPVPARSGKYEISFRFLTEGFRLPKRSGPVPETWGEVDGPKKARREVEALLCNDAGLGESITSAYVRNDLTLPEDFGPPK